MMDLYGGGPSRWVKCYWMLKELGLEFRAHEVSFAKGEHRSPEMLAMNPFGKMPVLKDGNTVLFESTAILNYLGEKYPEAGLVPRSGTVERALYDQWMSFCTTELEQPLWRILKHTRLLPDKLRSADDVRLARDDFAQVAKVFDAQIGDRRFMVGNHFTAVDITIAWTLMWANYNDLMGPFPNGLRYAKEMISRPAYPSSLRFQSSAA